MQLYMCTRTHTYLQSKVTTRVLRLLKRLSLSLSCIVRPHIKTVEKLIKHSDESNSFFCLWALLLLYCFSNTLTKNLQVKVICIPNTMYIYTTCTCIYLYMLLPVRQGLHASSKTKSGADVHTSILVPPQGQELACQHPCHSRIASPDAPN